MLTPRLMIVIVALLLISVWPGQYFASSLHAARISYDRLSLISMLGNDLIDNDPVADALLFFQSNCMMLVHGDPSLSLE